MSFVVLGVGAAVVGTAVSVGSKAYKGYQAATADYTDLYEGAAAVKQDQLDLLSGKRDLTGQQAGLQFDITGSALDAQTRNIGMGANMELRRTQAFGEQAYSQSNLASSGNIENKVQTQTKDLMAKYKSDMTKLFETRQFAGREKDLSRSEADLAYRSGELSAEEAYQNTLTGIESQDNSFWGGFTS